MRYPILTPMVRNIMGCLTLLLVVSGCDNVRDGSDAAVSVTSKAFSEATDTWSNIFTYHPKLPPQGAQTRYCYQLQSDIVCYDSIQPNSTSKLLGYQDGNKISWVQPGGGSLGASGGQPVGISMVATDSTTNAAESTPAFINPPVDPASKIKATNLPPAR